MVKAVTRFLLNNSRSVLVGIVLLTGLAVFALPKLRFDFSPQSVYAGANGYSDFMEAHRETFGHEDALTIVVLQATGERDVLDADALNWIDEFGRKAADATHVESVQSITKLQVPRVRLLSGERGVSTVPIVRSRPIDADAAEMIRLNLDDYALINGVLLSEDRKIATVIVGHDPDHRDMSSLRETIPELESIVEEFPPPSDYKIHFNGVPAVRVDIVRNLQADQLVMFPSAGSLFLLVSFLMFRSFKVTAITLTSVIVGVTWTFAIIALLGMPFTLLTNVVPTLLLIIGAANCVHLTSRFLEDVKRAGDVTRGMQESFPEMAVTCALTFGTTGIGFGSLLASQSDILRLFSLQVMIGLGCQYVSVLLMNALLFPSMYRGLEGMSIASDNAWVDRLIRPVGRYVSRQPKTVLAVTAVVVAVMLSIGSQLRVNSHIFEMYRPQHPTMQSLNLLNEHMSGVVALEINLQADNPDRLFEPQTYRKLDAFSRSFLADEQVLYTRSYVDIHQAVYSIYKRKPELQNEIPEDDEELQARIDKSISLIKKFDDQSAYQSFVTADSKAARILMRLSDSGTLRQNALINKMEADLAELFPESSGIQARVTGDLHLHARCMDGFVRDLFGSLLTASIIIFGVISLLFRSLRIGLVSAIPNITPLLVTLGYMVLLGYDMTVGNVIVFAIGLGIAVDDTIHFLARYREEIRKGEPVDAAIQTTFASSGRAIVLTTVLIVCGLSILVLSDFVPTVRFAELTGITMAAALLGDLMLLPACLMIFRPREKAGAASEVSPDEASTDVVAAERVALPESRDVVTRDVPE